MSAETTFFPPRAINDYVANIRDFTREDWLRYTCWVATLSFLFVGITAFLLVGSINGVKFPTGVWWISAGSGLFVFALAIDDIGHRTLYKDQLRKGEAHVHRMIMISAVGSVVALSLCFEHAELMHAPAFGLICLSLFYSAVDEALHWHRYITLKLDRVEMWSHFFAIMGHVIMITAWWHWYATGYAGVGETLRVLGIIVAR